MFAIGAELVRRGHGVTFATVAQFERDVRAAGMEFLDIPPRWDERQFAGWMHRMMVTRTPVELVRQLFRCLTPGLAETIATFDRVLPEYDLLLGSFLTPYLRPVAHRNGRPYASAVFAHGIVPNDSAPPIPLPPLRFGPRFLRCTWARLWWRVTDFVMSSALRHECGAVLKAQGLPDLRKFFTDPADEVLVLVEPRLHPPGEQVYPQFHYTGASRWQPAFLGVDLEPLRQAVGGVPVPVLTFGSMGYEQPQAWLERLARHWPNGRPLIVQSGWANFQPLSGAPWLHVVGKMPQDDLFKLASVVIHHGGAGTTATALASGKPQIIVPHIAEQGDWARDMKRLGVAVKISRRSWPEKLHRTIETVLATPALAERARELQPIAADTTGPGRAADRLERLARAGHKSRG